MVERQLLQFREAKVKMLYKHPMLDRKVEYFFDYMAMSVNAKCNNGCQNCCGLINNTPDIPLEKLKQVLKAVLKDGNVNVLYSSYFAEATLYPYINEMIYYLEDLKKKTLFVRQDTNGKYIPDSFIEAINSVSYVFDLSVSLWTDNKEDYEQYQGQGFDIVVENLKRYLKELKYPPSISAPYINEKQYNDLIAFLEPIINEAGYRMEIIKEDTRPRRLHAIKLSGAVPLYIRRYTQFVDTAEEVIVTDNETGKEIPKYRCNNCNLLFLSVNLLPDGSILPCAGTNKSKEFAIGNIFDYENFTWKDLVAMYYTPKARQLWEDNFTKGKYAFEKCKLCSARICN